MAALLFERATGEVMDRNKSGPKKGVDDEIRFARFAENSVWESANLTPRTICPDSGISFLTQFHCEAKMKLREMAMAVLLSGAAASAPSLMCQVPATLQPFVKIDAPVLVLENVRVIDGTGAPAKENQAIVTRTARSRGWTRARVACFRRVQRFLK
jgi:hypothetical protein